MSLLLRRLTTGGPWIVAVGRALETDLAQPLGKKKQRTIGLPTETDLAQPFGKQKRRTLGQALETDLALPITRGALGHSLSLGLALETDTAQPFAVTTARPGIGIGGSGTVWAGWSAEEFRNVSEWLARFDDDELAIVLALLS